MNKIAKQILSLVLCFVMLVGLVPVNALATDGEETVVESSEPTTTVETTEASSEPADPSGSEETASSPGESSEPEETQESEETEETQETQETEETQESKPDEVPVTGIELNKTELKLTVMGDAVMLIATVLPENATDTTVVWTSSDEEVASVNDGVVTPYFVGEAVITATAGEHQATCTVTVEPPEASDYAGSDGTIYVLAGGDFQEAGDHANSAANVTNILAQISQKYTTMNGFLFIGDYDCETHNDSTETANGIAALMGAVQGSYSNLNHDNSVLVQGNHDTMDSNIDSTGGHDFDGYSAYVLNEDDYPNGGGTQTGIQTLANNLSTWLTTKVSEGYDAPIFIVSHLPLAFTPRTVTQGDAKYAKLIFDVLNEAGEKGLNIIFLHGHDHAYGPDNYMGGEAIYLAEGDKICIAKSGSTSEWTEETLNFTYMNAGYTGYYSDAYTYNTTAGTDKLTMTVFAITDNQVTVERYSEDGLYNLKSAGYDGSYSDTSVTNVSLGLPKYSNVYTSPQTIALTADSGDTGSDGTEGGTIGDYVSGGVEEDVTTSGNQWVTITEATNGSEGSDPTYQYVLDTDGIDYGSGNKYLIVARNAAYLLDAGSGVAVTLSSDGKTATTSTTSYEYYFTTGGLITRDGTNTLYQSNWGIHVGNESGSNLNGFTNLGSGYYRIYDTDGTARSLYWDGDSWTVTSSDHTNSTYSVRLYKYSQTVPGTDATVGTNGLYGYLDGEMRYEVAAGTSADDAVAAVMEGVTVKYTTYEDYSNVGEYADDGAGMTWTLDSDYDGNKPGDYAVTIAYNGTELGVAQVVVNSTSFYMAEGENLYVVDMNTSADDALAAVKAGVTVYTASDANGTNKTAVSDDDVTWKWVDKYDGTNYGPYTVEILYNGTSLGTVEVKVDVQYDTEIVEGWTFIETTEGGYKYVLDTDGVDYNTSNTATTNRYIIVAADTNKALSSTPTGTVDVTISADGTTAIIDSRNHEYHFYRRGSNSYSYYICNGSGSYLYHGNYVFSLSTSRNNRAWTSFTHNGNGLYTLLGTDNNGAWKMYYSASNGDFRVQTSSSNVRLYKYAGEAEAADVYARIEGNTVYTVTQGKSATAALNTVKAGITGYISNNADGSDAAELADSKLTWKWKNTYNGNVPGSYWVEISYNGQVLGTVQVIVQPGIVNNYPEYPNEGSVKVSKTGTGIDFQSSGIAQVEVSASGVPAKKGADVIVMLDTSSSMNTYNVTGSDKTRLTVLEESMEDLVEKFQANGDDGEPLDIRVAIADFNGFNGYGGTSGTPYDRDENDRLSDGISYTANGNQAQIYTGSGTLSADAFVDAMELKTNWVGTLTYASGTNYDYAMDAIYQLGTAIKAANGSEERDLYVIFMSDGAAMQWNYYHSNGSSTNWQYWLTGAWDPAEIAEQLDCEEHAYYYAADVDGDGYVNELRMADAIKGSPSETYEVIRKTSDLGTAVSGYENLYEVPGLGATMFAIAFDPTTDQNTPPEAMTESIKTIASDQTGTTQYYYEVTAADQLSSAFAAIGNEIAYAAYNARFVDQMGDDYNLQMAVHEYKSEGSSTVDASITPKIEIISYDIYTKAEADAGAIPTGKNIGDRKGTYTVLETVTFSEDGTKAYSDQIGGGTTNILADGTDPDYVKGVIYAKTFLYNTNVEDVTVEGVSIPTGVKADGTTTGSTNVLPSETFYWKMGTVQTSELAMRYYVYLDGSMEGTKEAGSYPTNEFATLYYDNYLGNSCYKDTVSPVMAWKSANVSYAFYLVDEDGNIIVNQTTGETGSFANKIAVTTPVVYKEILLNNTQQVQVIDVAAISDDVLPKYYTLYDEGAVYKISINSNSTGNWEITRGDVPTASTYVTQYKVDDASAYSNALTNDTVGDDYTHTVVWFAVVWSVGAHPDAVVVDYGLPVDIHVLTNDMFGENGKLAGIGETSAMPESYEDAHTNTMNSGFGTSYTGKYGSAAANTTAGTVRYTLNSMEMDSYEKFAYAVNYTGSENAGYYYDTVTVIPATTIYYEDSFLTYGASNTEWVDEGTAVAGATQGEDRPGQYSLTDANNIYGYDGVNLNMSTYSLGTAKKVHVGADSYATASFTFKGTGFDVIGMTSNTTGVITVNVKDAAGTDVANKFVNTYYGYNYDGENWVATPDTANALYQVPVLQIENLTYGQYTVTITATYVSSMDKTTADGYDLYLDAIRIYDPANDGAADGTEDTTIENAYLADGEAWPSYIELRNKLIDADTLGNSATETVVTGLVFIDGDAEVGDAQISDYISYGPNNEVYLAPGQRVAFLLSAPEITKNIHIGIKSADGKTGTYTITNIAQTTNSETGVEAGKYYGAKTSTVNTTTDMYYDITGYKNDIIVISNTGNLYNTTGVISLTNIKATYTQDPNGVAVASEDYGISVASEDYGIAVASEEVTTGEVSLYMTPAAATLTLRSLNAAEPVESTPGDSIPEETVPETTVPEETTPETTVPEETTPETTVPEETEPEETTPETTVPEETEPEETTPEEQVKEIIKNVVNTVVNALKNLFSGWFR